jgi:mono/diheme cytochrome c family protein
MTHEVRRGRHVASGAIAALLLLGTSGAVRADDTTAPAQDAGASAEAPADAPPPEKPKLDVRKLFATNCSWCHGDFGLKASKGPKLAGTAMTAEQVYARIAEGKSGAMPGYEKTLSKEQIDAFVEYIKGLKDPG